MKRYILSGIIGGLFFAASYCLLNLDIGVSVIITLISFVSCIFLFKDKYNLDDLGIANDSEYRKDLAESLDDLKTLKNMVNQISDSKISKNVSNITKITDKIFKVLIKNPQKIASASKFMNYYLPITIKILERFDEMENQNLTSDAALELLDRIRGLIINIEIAFENQLNNLYNDEVIDTSAEIKVFETMLKSDGLLGNRIDYKKDGGDK